MAEKRIAKSGVWKWARWGVFVSIALFLAELSFQAADSGVASVKAVAPKWELKDVNGKSVRSSDFKGNVVLLDFWATWCPPCREEIPALIELQKQYGPQGLRVIGLSLDEQGDTVVRPFMKKNRINYPVVMADEKITVAYGGVEVIPTVFIIDRDGLIAKKHVGLAEKADLEKEIVPLLKK